jgi:hypothetical protein
MKRFFNRVTPIHSSTKVEQMFSHQPDPALVVAGKRSRVTGDGRSNAARPPFGYTRARVAGRITQDQPDAHAPLAFAAFERYATGAHSDLRIAQWLNAQGARTTSGRPFGRDTVRGMLQNRFYAGYVLYRGEHGRDAVWVRGAHKAIISDELFEHCQQVRVERAMRWPVRRSMRQTAQRAARLAIQRRVAWLGKLAVCAQCGRLLNSATSHGEMQYRCRARERGLECATRRCYVKQSTLRQEIDEVMAQRVGDWAQLSDAEKRARLQQLCEAVVVDVDAGRVVAWRWREE